MSPSLYLVAKNINSLAARSPRQILADNSQEVTHVDSGRSKKLPAQKTGGLYKTNESTWQDGFVVSRSVRGELS